ncbi:hypothetical protein ES707_05980 [subsurface metagenome]
MSVCEAVLENLWLIFEKLKVEIKKLGDKGGELPPVQQFNSIFFLRNIPYLISAFMLSEQGLVNPSRNIQRTIYEQILRSHLFLKYPDEADVWMQYWETMDDESEKLMKQKRWFGHAYMIDKLYEGKKKENIKAFYKIICGFAHPDIKSLWSDYDKIDGVPDTLNLILGLTYETILLLQKTFGAELSGDLHELCEDTKNIIGEFLGEIIDFVPNKS